MPNSIDINLNRDNNSMKSLAFHWQARFKNDSIIEQFEKDGSENRFQLVLDKWADLRYFYLTNNLDEIFCVDLIHGVIFFNNHQKIEQQEKKENIRLIFFRRHNVTIGNNIQEDVVTYHLGFQYNDKLGNNRKIILTIDKDGNWVMGDK